MPRTSDSDNTQVHIYAKQLLLLQQTRHVSHPLSLSLSLLLVCEASMQSIKKNISERCIYTIGIRLLAKPTPTPPPPPKCNRMPTPHLSACSCCYCERDRRMQSRPRIQPVTKSPAATRRILQYGRWETISSYQECWLVVVVDAVTFSVVGGIKRRPLQVNGLEWSWPTIHTVLSPS